MQLLGAAAPCARPLIDQAAEFVHQGRACLLWCDGNDVTLIAAGQAETSADLLALLPRVLPELAA